MHMRANLGYGRTWKMNCLLKWIQNWENIWVSRWVLSTKFDINLDHFITFSVQYLPVNLLMSNILIIKLLFDFNVHFCHPLISLHFNFNWIANITYNFVRWCWPIHINNNYKFHFVVPCKGRVHGHFDGTYRLRIPFWWKKT